MTFVLYNRITNKKEVCTLSEEGRAKGENMDTKNVNLERHKGLLFIKTDSKNRGQLMKYEIMQYLKNEGCNFLRMRYLVLTEEFLSLHYADIKNARPEVFQDIVDRFEGQIVTALEVELPMTYDDNYQSTPMSCEEFRDTIIGPTFVHKDGIREKVAKEYKKSEKEYTQKEVEVTTELRYTAAQKTMRGKIANQLEYVTNDDLKTFNACHYSASAEEAKAELDRVFGDEGFDGRIVSRIIEAPEINEIMNKVHTISYNTQECTKGNYELLRYKFDAFREEMISYGHDFPEEFLVERYSRSFDDPRFLGSAFAGDKLYLNFTKDMVDLSTQILKHNQLSIAD